MMQCIWVYYVCTNVSEEIAASVCTVAHEECAWVAALRSVLGLAWVTVPLKARGIHSCPSIFSYPTSVYIAKMYVCLHVYDCVKIV
jgi:hypothetical protein